MPAHCLGKGERHPYSSVNSQRRQIQTCVLFGEIEPLTKEQRFSYLLDTRFMRLSKPPITHFFFLFRSLRLTESNWALQCQLQILVLWSQHGLVSTVWLWGLSRKRKQVWGRIAVCSALCKRQVKNHPTPANPCLTCHISCAPDRKHLFHISRSRSMSPGGNDSRSSLYNFVPLAFTRLKLLKQRLK